MERQKYISNEKDVALTNSNPDVCFAFPKASRPQIVMLEGGLALLTASVTSCSRWKDHWGYATSGLDVSDILGRPPWVGNMAPLSPDTDRTGSRDFAR